MEMMVIDDDDDDRDDEDRGVLQLAKVACLAKGLAKQKCLMMSKT